MSDDDSIYGFMDEEAVNRLFDNPSPKKKNEEDAELEAKQFRVLVADLLKHPSGRKFLVHILRKTYLFHSTFTGNSLGQFLEGRRSIGLELLKEVTYVESGFIGDVVKEGILNMQEIYGVKE